MGKTDLENKAATGILKFREFPQLAPNALPSLVGEIVECATDNSEADPAAVLATLLGAAGAYVGRSPYVRVGDDQHHARLFSVLAGQSARARKGTSEAPIRRIMDKVEESLGPFNWKPGPMSSGEGLINAIRDGDGQQDKGVQDKRVLIVESEFAAPLRAMQRQGNTLSTVLRSGWDGKTLEPLTKTLPIKATAPHICIVGHITETELRSLLGRVDIFNGFANRFLWWCVRRSKLVPLAKGMSEKDVDRLGKALAGRLSAARKLSEVQFSDDAREFYRQLYPVLTEDHSGIYGVVTARAEAQTIRLALIYTLLNGATTICCDHVEAAIAVWEFCDASARALFAQVVPDPVEERIRNCLEGGPKSTTDLHDALQRHVKGPILRQTLETLLASGTIEKFYEQTGGRPRTLYRHRRGIVDANYAKKGASLTHISLNSLSSRAGVAEDDIWAS